MRRDDAVFLIHNNNAASNVFKMTKAKTAMILVMIICSCGLIFSITDAFPTPDPVDGSQEEPKPGNNSRLVITHVVKTIEFEVGIIDDDGTMDDNSTDLTASKFYETDIELLNMDLLKEVMNQATGDENMEATVTPRPENEEKSVVEPQNDYLTPLDQSDS